MSPHLHEPQCSNVKTPRLLFFRSLDLKCHISTLESRPVVVAFPFLFFSSPPVHISVRFYYCFFSTNSNAIVCLPPSIISLLRKYNAAIFKYPHRTDSEQ